MVNIKNIVKSMLSIVACTFLLAFAIVSVPFAIVDLLIFLARCLTVWLMEENENAPCERHTDRKLT